jgi:hypothetical protein
VGKKKKVDWKSMVFSSVELTSPAWLTCFRVRFILTVVNLME